MGITYKGVGEAEASITIAAPVFKVYAITVLDTADATMSSTIGISAMRSAAGDADNRLRQGPIAGVSSTASPTSGDLTGGSVWLFLPGDDGDDLPDPAPASILWTTTNGNWTIQANLRLT